MFNYTIVWRINNVISDDNPRVHLYPKWQRFLSLPWASRSPVISHNNKRYWFRCKGLISVTSPLLIKFKSGAPSWNQRLSQLFSQILLVPKLATTATIQDTCLIFLSAAIACPKRCALTRSFSPAISGWCISSRAQVWRLVQVSRLLLP